MSKKSKILVGLLSLVTALIAVNLICKIFSTQMQKYYTVDDGRLI